MRKDLLLLAALTTAASASALAPKQLSKKLAPLDGKASVTNAAVRSNKVKDLLKADPKVVAPARVAATRSEETLNMQWGYCYDPYNAFQLDDNEVNQAIYVAPELTGILAGATLKNVVVANPVDAMTYLNPVESCTVWVKENLDGEPIAEGTGVMGAEGFEWSSIALSQPITIEEGKGFYVGVSYTLPSDTSYGYLTDYTYPEYNNTNLAYTALEGYDEEDNPIIADKKSWKNIGFSYGNACIRLDVYGDNLPTNIAQIDDFIVPAYVAPGEKVEVMLSVTNYGANNIKDVEISLQYAGEEAQIATSETYLGYDYNWNLVPGELPYGYTGIVVAEFDCPKTEGNFQYELKVSKINGDGDNNDDSETAGYLLCLAGGFHKNVVVEEATGLWCGYCPVGYAGMEYIKEYYAEDGVIGVALHEGDVMDVLDNGAFSPIAQYIDGFPSCFYNRNLSASDYPSPDYLDLALYDLISIPACASIEASLETASEPSAGGKSIRLVTKSDFLLNGEEGEYEVAYTVIEDQVGPYLQTNYFSGAADEDSYGFGSKNNPCPLFFNDVARNCSRPMGIEGSLPAVEKGSSYEFACDIDLEGVNNVNNSRVVAMIINKKSGLIENAAVVSYPSDPSGVNMVAAKSAAFARGVKGAVIIDGDNSDVNVYSASGMKIAKATGFRIELPAGIYVVTRGAESMKVVVK